MGCDNFVFFFFCKQKTAYEMRISDWSSDVCSSDLPTDRTRIKLVGFYAKSRSDIGSVQDFYEGTFGLNVVEGTVLTSLKNDKETFYDTRLDHRPDSSEEGYGGSLRIDQEVGFADLVSRSEEHTSARQSLMRIS